ncbi:hypothetical protein Tco_0245120 [Tanacetum coccineum]
MTRRTRMLTFDISTRSLLHDEVPKRPEGCPHHGFSELHQLDTFYNALNSNDQDSLNFAAGGNFLDKMPRECLKIIESKSIVSKVSTSSSTPAVSSDVAELKDMVSVVPFTEWIFAAYKG